MSFIISWIGYCFIFFAVYFNRDKESNIPLFSRKWIIMMLIVMFGFFLIETGKKIQQQEKIKAHIEQTNPKTIGSSLTDNSY